MHMPLESSLPSYVPSVRVSPIPKQLETAYELLVSLVIEGLGVILDKFISIYPPSLMMSSEVRPSMISG